ncbi:hypothetical protein ACHAW6_013176 [Cyclotella cf. meneghiniana]
MDAKDKQNASSAPLRIIAYVPRRDHVNDDSEVDVARSLELPLHPHARLDDERPLPQQQQRRRARDRDDFRTSVTPIVITTDLLVDSDEGSFWNLAPRWTQDVYDRASRSMADSSAWWRSDRQEIVCARDGDDESDSIEDLSSFGGTETGRWSLLTGRSVKSAVVRGVFLLGVVGMGMALLVALTAAMSHQDRVRLQWSSWMDFVRDSRLFRMRTNRRYFSMKARLMNISGALTLDDEMTPQHRALVFLSDGDPLALDPNDATASTQLIQRYALAVLYYATEGAAWNHRIYWLTGQHECGWQFVVCAEIQDRANLTTSINATSKAIGEEADDVFLSAVDADLGMGTGRIVTGLQLYGNNLRGTLPIELITTLKYLEVLDLGNNMLHGSLANYRQLTYLRHLYLNSNNITGTIPQGMVSGLIHLKTLAIGNNQLSGTIPVKLFDDLISLERLNLEGNRLTGNLPDIFDRGILQDVRLGDNLLTGTILPSLLGGVGSRSSSITKCDLHGNQLTGKLPVVVNAPNLKFLYLYDNKLSGPIPGDLFCSGFNLADIRLNNNSLSGEIPNIRCTMPELQLISLASNVLTGSIPSSLGDLMPRVREIHLFGNKLTSTIPDSLLQPSNLTAVLLGNNALTGSLTATMFSNANRLEVFYANANRLSGNLNGISNAKHLVKLRLEYNSLTGTIPVMSLPQLELFYAYNNSLTGPLPAESDWANMRKLKLSNNSLTGEVIVNAANKLEILSLNGNAFTGSIPSEIGQLIDLKTLSLQSNRLFGTVPSELHNLSLLEELRLDSNGFSGVVPKDVCDLRNLSLNIFVSDCRGSWPKISCSCCTECF